MRRRLGTVLGLIGLLWWTNGVESAERLQSLRFGLTAVVLQDQAQFLGDWSDYLEARLGREVEFVQRGSYAEISELLSKGEVDVAWVCGAPYVRHARQWRLVAVPVFRGQPMYRSYLLVQATDRARERYEDLSGAVFAFSDPDSNSGYLVPQYELSRRGLRAGTLFRKSFFTWAHQDTVRAVAVGLAQAGAVDSYIWETLAEREPALTARTRVVEKSDWYGFPPIVARGSLPEETLETLRAALTGMHDDQGKRLLERLNLDAFITGEDELFDGIRRIIRFVDGHYAQRPEL